MTDRTVHVLEQAKLVMRGLKPRGRAAVLSIDENEKLSVTIKWARWLGTDTIASVSNEVTSVSLTSPANTTTQASFNVEATDSGWIEHRITTAAGQVKELLILVECNSFPVMDDYGKSWRYA